MTVRIFFLEVELQTLELQNSDDDYHKKIPNRNHLISFKARWLDGKELEMVTQIAITFMFNVNCDRF